MKQPVFSELFLQRFGANFSAVSCDDRGDNCVENLNNSSQSYFIDRQLFSSDMGQIAPPLMQMNANLQRFWQTANSELMALADGDADRFSKSLRQMVEQRTKFSTDQAVLPDACVLVAISDEDRPRVLLTRRATTLNSHAGEVSFVGGKRDETDRSSLMVAAREAFEEVALLPADITPLSFLPMQFSKKGLLVRPVVVQVAAAAADKLCASSDEIANVFWLPIDTLRQPPVDIVFDETSGFLPKGQRLHTPAWIAYDGEQTHTVWGLTGRMLANLMDVGFGVQHEWYYRVRMR